MGRGEGQRRAEGAEGRREALAAWAERGRLAWLVGRGADIVHTIPPASTRCSRTSLTSGSQGGLFVTDDEQAWRLAGLLQYLGELVVPGRERETQAYNAYGLGRMHRCHKLGLAFTRSQLQRLDAYNEIRRQNAARLEAALAGVRGVRPVASPPDRTPVRYEFVLRFSPEDLGLNVPAGTFREAVQAGLRAEGVPTRRWQTWPVPAQGVFQARQGYGRGCPWTCHGSTVTELAAQARKPPALAAG